MSNHRSSSIVITESRPASPSGADRRPEQGYSLTVSNRAGAAGLGIARVVAHCGGNLATALHYLTAAMASAPESPEPYTVLAELWRDKPADLRDRSGCRLLAGGTGARLRQFP